jgi:cyclophilin family peptidyl-prolyl cis-trans isomerase
MTTQTSKVPVAQFVSLVILTAILIVGAKMYRANSPTPSPTPNTAKTAVISTDKGDIKIELFEKDAPKTVENFEKLAEKNYYNGIIFHRVIKDFMIQTGDPTGTGTGGESAFGKDFEDEINSHKIEAGTLAMANRGPNTNGSQFFIVTEQAQPHLDGKHTVFGKVIEGMDIVRAIASVPVNQDDKPTQDVKIKSVTITNP